MWTKIDLQLKRWRYQVRANISHVKTCEFYVHLVGVAFFFSPFLLIRKCVFACPETIFNIHNWCMNNERMHANNMINQTLNINNGRLHADTVTFVYFNSFQDYFLHFPRPNNHLIIQISLDILQTKLKLW